MDKKRQFIVQFGSDKYKTKYITHVDHKDIKQTLRVFFYDTEGRALSGLKSEFTWLNDMIHYYPEILDDPKIPHVNNKDSYNKFIKTKLLEQLEVVKVEMNINEIL